MWVSFIVVVWHTQLLSQLNFFPTKCDLFTVWLGGSDRHRGKTYPQACERWGQGACMDFVCLFGSWMSWGLGLLWGNSRANSHFGEREARFCLSVSVMQFCWHNRCCLRVTPFWKLSACVQDDACFPLCSQSRQCKGLICIILVGLSCSSLHFLPGLASRLLMGPNVWYGSVTKKKHMMILISFCRCYLY